MSVNQPSKHSSTPTNLPLRVAVAGSTAYSLQCAQVLHEHAQFQVTHVITPTPAPSGRTQTRTPNPLHAWADANHIPVFQVQHSLTEQKTAVSTFLQPQPDLLLVVDFGYILPKSLLKLPKLGAINVHPSLLPAWRGSSPGQAVLLSGALNSAVTIMVMDEQMDHGPILTQIPFDIGRNWDTQEYYDQSFTLAAQALSEVLLQFSSHQIEPQPQPDTSPTPTARKLTKQDSFVPFELIMKTMNGDTTLTTAMPLLNPLLQQFFHIFSQQEPLQAISTNELLGLFLCRATQAFSPWPILWTEIPTAKGPRSMQIISCSMKPNHTLQLDTVKIAGQDQAQWNQVKNIVSTA